jgi:TolB-like protein
VSRKKFSLQFRDYQAESDRLDLQPRSAAAKSRAAATLNATHILDSSVHRTDDHVRIAANLTGAESGVVLV